MLILTRKNGQSILIGENIEVFITSIEGDQVKIGINAPNDTRIYRKEVFEAIQQSNREAITELPNIENMRKMLNLEDV
ncbi:carbon storage regulator [Paenibacillus sp. V4I9]|uniref:carbon storage regulator CsrA n=1 Tax=unclassified Paenibacillus TaxID=185978 RepID=UPI00087E1CEC|nr:MULTISPECIES: carbon storage regulator CsrA [unclassified Paenibacillus]MDQ0891970.1 carbon storage regulator [Paenibacillus sp. V4I9]SDO61561.1 carbon storage regulator, CsrA [Paenibacillus sp. yr247]